MAIDQFWFKAHDMFNLVCLPLVLLPNVLYVFDLGSERYFMLQYVVFLTYMIVDSIWLIIKPNSVPKVETILYHHLITAIGWNFPVVGDMEYRRVIALGPLVEFNTFFMILRRNVGHHWLVEFFFYLTWIVIRLGVYHYALLSIIWKYYHLSHVYATYINTGLLVLLFLLFLNYLNLKWSIDLYNKTFNSKNTNKNGKFMLT